VPWNPADHRLVSRVGFATQWSKAADLQCGGITGRPEEPGVQNPFTLTAGRNSANRTTRRVGVGRRSKRRQGWLVHTGYASTFPHRAATEVIRGN
jgi:hypothetical protein